MKKLILSFLILSLFLSISASKLKLSYKFDHTNFFDEVTFLGARDTTNWGYSWYMTKAESLSKDLHGYTTDNKVRIQADHTTKNPTHEINGTQVGGRWTHKLLGKQAYRYGFFVADIEHMPEGVGSWPAYWYLGTGKNWPDCGEIDVLEIPNDQNRNFFTLHTKPGCHVAPAKKFDQILNSTDNGPGEEGLTTTNWTEQVTYPVQYNHDCQGGSGCSFFMSDNSSGPGFNKNKGGVYAFYWTEDFLRGWWLPREEVEKVHFLVDKENSEQPENWEEQMGKPSSEFLFKDADGKVLCDKSFFEPQRLIIDTTFCGDFAGGRFPSDYPDLVNEGWTCDRYVAENPEMYKDAYWLFNYIKIYGNEENRKVEESDPKRRMKEYVGEHMKRALRRRKRLLRVAIGSKK